jgi:hypothetical protein
MLTTAINDTINTNGPDGRHSGQRIARPFFSEKSSLALTSNTDVPPATDIETPVYAGLGISPPEGQFNAASLDHEQFLQSIGVANDALSFDYFQYIAICMKTYREIRKSAAMARYAESVAHADELKASGAEIKKAAADRFQGALAQGIAQATGAAASGLGAFRAYKMGNAAVNEIGGNLNSTNGTIQSLTTGNHTAPSGGNIQVQGTNVPAGPNPANPLASNAAASNNNQADDILLRRERQRARAAASSLELEKYKTVSDGVNSGAKIFGSTQELDAADHQEEERKHQAAGELHEAARRTQEDAERGGIEGLQKALDMVAGSSRDRHESVNNIVRNI